MYLESVQRDSQVTPRWKDQECFSQNKVLEIPRDKMEEKACGGLHGNYNLHNKLKIQHFNIE